MKQKISAILAPVVAFVVIFLGWELIVRAMSIPQWLLPMPTEIFRSMVVDFAEYWPHILVTFETVLFGFLIAVPLGILLSCLITSNRVVSAALSPYITFLVVTPLMTLVPLLMLMMGYGIKVRIVAVVIQSFAVVNMNACTGILNVPIIRRELMQTLGANKLQTYSRVLLPTAATDIFTGVRLAGILATTACISTEYVGGNTGLGSQIIKNSNFLRTTESFACIFFVTIIGLIMYGLITFAQKKIISWKE